MNLKIAKAYINFTKELHSIVENFDTKGSPFRNQDRNSLKLFNLNEKQINVKSFKVPNFMNQIVYKFFRRSKAQRSFEYALKLREFGIGTPEPIAFFELSTLFLFKKSFYISEQLDCDITFRELNTNLNYPNHEVILRAFTRFTFQLQEHGVYFLDHSPGNTLVKKNHDTYSFYLVDLNRMKFKTLDFETRIKNFARLTIYKSMVKIMSDEYAKCTNGDYETIFNLMWRETELFQKRFRRKKYLKKKIMFWKKY